MRGKSFIFILSLQFFFIVDLPDLKAVEREILIIVNKETSIESLGLNTLVDIYTNNKTKWDNGEKIHVSMLKKGPVHDAFSKDMIGMAPKKLVSVWKKVIFTGLGTPPKVVNTEAEMIRYVASTKGAIGYISASVQPENVNVFKLN